MAIPVNQEHKEAEQEASNKERETFIATLPKADREKFKAVSKAVQLLVKADVSFYIFPLLPSYVYKGKDQIWQWNSLTAKVKYDDKGQPIQKSLEENSVYHEAFFSFLFSSFGHFFKGENIEQKLNSMPYFFHHCLIKHRDYLAEEKNEETKE